MKLSIDELNDNLQEQLELLELSASKYDEGHVIEAKNIAVRIRVLFHDTPNSKSLLSHLEKKDKIMYLDTSYSNSDKNIATYHPLVMINHSSSGTKFKPLLDDAPPIAYQNVNFDSWWNKVIFIDNNKNEFTRCKIVKMLANKDGGAHVEGSLPKDYSDLKKNNTLGWCITDKNGKKSPLPDPVPASIRQIAHEVLKTLKGNINFITNEPYVYYNKKYKLK